MKQKIFYIVLFTFLMNATLFVVGCNKVPDCGSGATTFDLIKLDALNVEMHNNGQYIEIPDQGVVNSSQFVIQLIPEFDFAYQQHSNWEFSGLLINTAIACRPAPPVSDEVVDSISIFSDSDFSVNGQTIPAGSNLNEHFSIQLEGETDLLLLSQYNSEMDQERKSVNLLNYSLKMTTPVSSNQAHQFAVHYSDLDGEVYIMTTNSVELTP